jgi:predicted CXXCH cytochrome family protein
MRVLAIIAIWLCACTASHRAAPPPEPRSIEQHASTTYVGSRACAPCHRAIYDRWVKTPMANVVRDPKQDPSIVLADLTKNDVAPFKIEDIALVYGSRWKQRYLRKVGDDYFPETAQWDVKNKVWRKYFVGANTDWWEPYYPPDNSQRPTGPLCDGCHSVGYDVKTKQVAEWNVGCERCHGGGSEHVAAPSKTNILNPSRMDDTHADDVCIQCHSQGRPTTNPIEGRYFDWPVGFRVGLDLSAFWQLEDHKLGETTFMHFADGTAHKNRMQGNDFVRSVMARRGVTCASCHDVHGTDNPGQLRERGNALCLQCHSPNGANGPAGATLSAHTQHAATSAGSECVACHMPLIETTIANVRVRAHTFEFITPAMTDKYGMPNPCTTCHTDKTTRWATDVLARGHSPWRVR